MFNSNAYHHVFNLRNVGLISLNMFGRILSIDKLIRIFITKHLIGLNFYVSILSPRNVCNL